MKRKKELIIGIIFNLITVILDFICATLQFLSGSKLAGSLFLFAGICFIASIFLKVLEFLETKDEEI